MRLTLLAVLALAGCATANVQADMDAGLQRLMGRDVHTAIDVLGYPTSQTEIAGDTVYDWYVEREGVVSAPANSYQVGAGGQVKTTYANAYVPARWQCKVRLAVLAGGDRLGRYEYDGHVKACLPLVNRLEAWMKPRG